MANKSAHTLTELLVASVIIVFLFISALGAYLLAETVYYDNMATSSLQRDLDIVLATIIQGVKEPTGRFGLRCASPCSTTPAMPSSEIDFLYPTDNPPVVRKFLLTNNTIAYDSPTQNPVRKVIYTPPANSNLTLSFSKPINVAIIDEQAVTIYISVLQQRRNRISVGSSTTTVNLRNTPK